MDTANATKLAIHGGPKALSFDTGDICKWPIVTEEDENAVLEVLRAGSMSGTDITKKFEEEFAAWQGTKYALAHCNGTAALQAAMWACEVGMGTEIICPSLTYWASAAPALSLGASVNFADVDPLTLGMDPNDIEHRICDKTRAIVVVHYAGHPADMDAIMAIARKHNVRVIEDVSHAQGGMYKGRKCGTLGDIGAMSLMAGKSFAIGEGGIIVTNEHILFQRCVAFGHYERTGMPSLYNPVDKQVVDESLAHFAGAPIGCCKHRLNQTASAMGRVQLKHYDARIAEIDRAMNRFWDLLEGVPGLHAIRPAKGSGSTMGGWYACKGRYAAEELGGLPIQKFCEAVRQEGCLTSPGANAPLHLHPLFNDADIFHSGKPTMIAFADRDVRQGPGALPVAEAVKDTAFSIPWFKHDRPEIIAACADAFRKVAENADALR